MNLLAIDTSTDLASIALLTGTQLLSREQDSQKTHAQWVLPLIDELLSESSLSLSQLDGIVFGYGPGSFTGLRIACSIAKGLAYAHDLDLIPVSSLDAIAYQARKQLNNPSTPILAVLDARMHELYWSYYPDNQLLAEAQVNPAKDIQIPQNETAVIAGVGIETYWADFSETLTSQLYSPLVIYPKAAAMIQLAQDAAISPISAESAHPQYIRNQVVQGDKRG
jgi:tRNA threonylcarbamoyladenosine biosynthesis protein TsaB